MRSQRLSIRLSEEVQENLAALVQSTGKTESDVVREALMEYCCKHSATPSCYVLAKNAGLIGCMKGGPRDLSKNPKNMEGFGRD